MSDLREAMARAIAGQVERCVDKRGVVRIQLGWHELSNGQKRKYTECALAALAALDAAGFAVVPKEARAEARLYGIAEGLKMAMAYADIAEDTDEMISMIRAAMLAAAPKAAP